MEAAILYCWIFTDFPSNTRGQAVYANQVNQIDNTQWRKFKRQIEQIKLKKTKIHLSDDQGTVLSTSTTEQDEDDDKSSAMSVSSTETGTVNTLLKN